MLYTLWGKGVGEFLLFFFTFFIGNIHMHMHPMGFEPYPPTILMEG
jgi:hypothetical protein